MAKSIYLFATSERPDQYLNPIVHCLLEPGLGINKVVLFHIKGFDGGVANKDLSEKKGLSGDLLRNVQVLLDSLANYGEYRFFTGEKAGERKLLSEVYDSERVRAIQSLYKKCLDREISWVNSDIKYLDLRNELKRIQATEPESIFDVTGSSKAHLGDILSVSIIEGIREIYTFDFKIKPDHDNPWTMLIHDLNLEAQEKRKYKYVNIVDTHFFRESSNSILIRTPSIKISNIAAFVFLIAMLVAYFAFGQVNPFVQVAYILSTVASLLSLYFNFFPPRK